MTCRARRRLSGRAEVLCKAQMPCRAKYPTKPGHPTKLRCQERRREQARRTSRPWGAGSPEKPCPRTWHGSTRHRVPLVPLGSGGWPCSPPGHCPWPCSPSAVAPPCRSGSGRREAPQEHSADTHQCWWSRCTSVSPRCCRGTSFRAPGTCGRAASSSACLMSWVQQRAPCTPLPPEPYTKMAGTHLGA